MVRTIATLAIGALLGAFVMLGFEQTNPDDHQSAQEVTRDIVDVPTMARAVADKHRDEHYEKLTTVEQIVSLPTVFARSEAMYALAGRADPALVQKLIFEADRVAVDVQRIELLSILFVRLAETDPNSALALTRIDRIKGTKQFGQIVWHTWGQMDLPDALRAAKLQSSVALRNAAAQSLYAAFGYMGNDTVEQIETVLGIGPDRITRSRYLYQLADSSPADAIAFINNMQRGAEKQRNVQWLAEYLAVRNPEVSLTYANLFVAETDSERYRTIVSNRMASDNPQATIERLLASGENVRMNGEYRSAVRALAATDIDAAKYYFEQSRSADDRQVWGTSIASQMATDDPVKALAWARENDAGDWGYIQMTVLRQIAQTDPQLAMTGALETPNSQIKSNIISMVVQQIARSDPANAVGYLEQISGRQQRLGASQQLASSWIQNDFESALEWIQSHDEETVGHLLRNAGQDLIRNSIDDAIRLLPALGEQDRMGMQQQIVQQLATTGSAQEAQSYIAQFRGEPGYDKLQASLVAGIAQTDVYAAKQMADQLTDSDARDSAYAPVIVMRAQTDPAEAVRWLNNIKDEAMRGTTAGQLASQWYGNDPSAAMQWVSNLPLGTQRDDAVMQMSYVWEGPTSATDKLIASIGDQDKRGQAKVRQIYSLVRSNPARARELLQDEDIPSYQRQRVESALNRISP